MSDKTKTKPAPDWRQAFLDAMDWADLGYEFHKTIVNDTDNQDIKRLRALRDAAKGDKTDA